MPRRPASARARGADGGEARARGLSFTAPDVRTYRAIAAAVSLVVLGDRVITELVLPDARDPWAQRATVAAAFAAFAAWPWRADLRGFRVALYALVAFVTAWVFNLLRLNAFAPEYDVGLLMVAALIGAVIRSPRALAVYGACAVAGMFGVAAAVPAPGIHPPFLATRLAVILAVCVVMAQRQRQGARELAASEARFRAIFDHAAVGVALHDADGAILEANPAYEQITGYARAELLAMRTPDLTPDLTPPEDGAVTRAPVHALEAGGREAGPRERVAVERRVRRKDGAIRRCALTVTRVDRLDAAGAGPGLVGMLQDVTEHRALEDELRFRAYHDPLTGLANRAQFHDRLAVALRAAETEGVRPDAGAAVAVLLIDLDGFKLVNDAAGHAAGDALLREVAARLLDAARDCELVARLGGDEFAVLLAGVRGDAEALAVAERIVAVVGRPFTACGVTATVGLSVGIALGGAGDPAAPAGAPPLAAVDALLRDADLALYEAKARGKGQAAVFEAGMHAAAVARVALEAALRGGLERAEFRLVYQPIVDLATGAITGVEALVRWAHPTRGLVPPAEFIPLAEETGLIRPLGRWVLEEACRQGAAWAAAGNAPGAAPMSVTVNVSGRQLQQAAFVDEVRAALEGSGFPAGGLVLELTESTVIHQPEVARERLGALKALGVRLAIDDFGTGYSALSYLRQFPIDLLKIDKSFVDEIAGGGQPAALAGAIVGLGDALNLRTVAEGVESAEQAAALERLGCALAQGYHFSRPVAADAITALLAGRPHGFSPTAATAASATP